MAVDKNGNIIEKKKKAVRRSISKSKLYRETVKMTRELDIDPGAPIEDYLAAIKNSMMDDLIGDLDG